MSGSVHVTSDFLDTFKYDLDEVFSLQWDKEKFEFEDVYSTDTTTDPFVDDYMFQTPSVIQVVEEGAGYPRVSIERVGHKQHVVFTLRTEMAFTEEDIEDQKYKKLKDGAGSLSTALHRTIEILAAQNIWLGHTSRKGIDNVSIFNDAHPLSLATGDNPTTYDNASTLSLNVDNLKARVTNMIQQRDENGDLIAVMPKLLVYGPNNFFTATQILENEWETGTADRNKNPLKNLLTPKMMTFLAMSPYSGNDWYLFDPKIMRLRFYWRVKPQSRIAREEKTDNYLYRIRTRIALGWTDWRGADGNTGAS